MTDQDDERQPLLRTVLENGVIFEFFTFEEIKTWLDNISSSLSALFRNMYEISVGPSHELKLISNKAHELKGLTERILRLSIVPQEEGEKLIKSLNDLISNHFLKGAEFEKVTKLSVENLLGQGEVSSANTVLVDVLSIPSAIVDPMTNQGDSLKKLRSGMVSEFQILQNWESDPWLSELKNRADVNREDVNLLKQRLDASEELNGRLSADIQNFKKDVAGEIHEAKAVVEKAENANEALQDKLALDEASNYWSNKRASHMRRLKWISTGLFAWLALNGCALYKALGIYQDKVQYAQDFYDLAPHLPVNILLVVLAVWGARVLVRLILSENHLATRAEEKGILIKTYVALVNEGVAEKEDRSIILAYVFSHTQDGLVQDDGMPTSGPLNSITKAGS